MNRRAGVPLQKPAQVGNGEKNRAGISVRVNLFIRGNFISNTKAKNAICLWFNKNAQDAANFYAGTFPDSKVLAIHKAPGDYPGGKKGQVLTVEFTVLGIPCLGLNGGPQFKHSAAFSFQVATDTQEETDRYWNAIRQQRWSGKRVRLVQRPLGNFLANRAASDNGCAGRRRR